MGLVGCAGSPRGGVRYDVRATISLAGEDGDLYQREAVFSLRAAVELGDEAGIPARLAVEAPPGHYVASVVLRAREPTSASGRSATGRLAT